jgi:dimethylamine/trimethylamine dehydrogenase
VPSEELPHTPVDPDASPPERYAVLFEPVRIGPKVAPNRFYQVPHSTGFGSERFNSQARFRATKAEGGWGTVCLELCSIGEEADRAPLPVPARLWDDADVRALSVLCSQAHDSGALVGIELWHGGSSVDLPAGRRTPGAPTQLPSDAFALTYPRELDRRGIREIQAQYTRAAVRAHTAGFDIVYVYGAHGYLPLQFLSPFYNKRTDEYGGTLANRARFWLETLDLVRAEVGDDCAVAVRLGIESEARDRVHVDDALEFVALADDLVDLWDINTSTIAEPWQDMSPSRLGPAGYQLPVSGRIREATSKPIVGVGRLTDPDMMVEIIRSGVWDLIGGARPSIADPYLPSKIRQGRVDDIVECIGCNICVSRVQSGYGIACTQNPTAGEEFRRGWHPESVPHATRPDRQVIVVGAGPAGMQCAMVLGRRGLRHVRLVEARPEIGGAVNYVARLPGLGEWSRIVTYRANQLRKLANVEVITGVPLDQVAVLSAGADTVVLATGAHWLKDGTSHLTHAPIPGFENAEVFSPLEIIDGRLPDTEDVTIYDCEGYFMGVGVTELLAMSGRHRRVELVTPHQVVGPFLDKTFEGHAARRRLAQLGVVVHTETELVSLGAGNCRLKRYGQVRDHTSGGFVLVTARRSDDSLYRRLMADPEVLARAGIEQVLAIGDCAAPRLLAESIFDGHRVALELDTPQAAAVFTREVPLFAGEPPRPSRFVPREASCLRGSVDNLSTDQ